MSQDSPEQAPGAEWGQQYGSPQYGSQQSGSPQSGGQQYGVQQGGGPFAQAPGQAQFGQEFPGYAAPVQGVPVPGQPGQPGYGGQSQTDDKTWAMLAYLSTIVVSFLGPLVIYFSKKDQSPFVRHHAAQSLNMMITSTIASIVLFVLAIVTGVVTHGFGFGLFLLVWFAYGIVLLVYVILAAVAANRGELYQAPAWVSLRLVH